MRAFAFDIDGVLIRGGKALAGARSALNLLNRKRIPWILLTNGGGMTEQDRVDNLSKKLDVNIHPGQFMQSHTPFQDFVGNYDRVMVVGGANDRCRKVAESYGFKDVVIPADIVHTWPHVTPYPCFTSTFPGSRQLVNPEKPFDALFVFHDSRDATTDTQILCDLLTSKDGVIGTRKRKFGPKPSVPIYFSNDDLQWVAEYQLPRFGQGALVDMVETLYKNLTGFELEKTVIGKPTKLTYDYAKKLLQSWTSEPITEVFMIGDNQFSDIRGANDNGWSSVLVRTGVYQDSDDLITEPTYIVDNVLDAVETALSEPDQPSSRL